MIMFMRQCSKRGLQWTSGICGCGRSLGHDERNTQLGNASMSTTEHVTMPLSVLWQQVVSDNQQPIALNCFAPVIHDIIC